MAKRVLIVDDDQAMAGIIEDTLIEYGYEPSKAHSLEAAYELLSRQAVELIILDINLPDKVELALVECEEAVKGDTATNALKNAVTETGLLVKVPMFIKGTDRIIVSTADGKYTGRA